MTDEVINTIYGDTLKPSTQKSSVILIVLSLVAFSVASLKARLVVGSLVPIDFGEQSEVLPGMLGAFTMLACLDFMLKSFSDILLEREKRALVDKYIEDERKKTALAAAKRIDHAIYQDQQEDEGVFQDPWYEDYETVRTEADERVASIQAKLGTRRGPRWFRTGRIATEVAVPIFFAAVAVYAALGGMYSLIEFLFRSSSQ